MAYVGYVIFLTPNSVQIGCLLRHKNVNLNILRNDRLLFTSTCCFTMMAPNLFWCVHLFQFF